MTSMNIEIRKAEQKDILSIIDLHSEMGLSNEQTSSLQNAKIIFSKIQSYPNSHIDAALIQREIIGTFACYG
jgi:hypothetical protein